MKIISNCRPGGTRVYADDGRDITRDLKIRHIEIHLDAINEPRCILQVLPDAIEITSLDDDTVTYKKVRPSPAKLEEKPHATDRSYDCR